MNISNTYFLYINIVILVIYLGFAYSGYKNGLLLQLVSLVYNAVAIICAYIVAPILGGRFPIVKLEGIYAYFTTVVNDLIWGVIVFFILRIFFVLLKGILKKISKLPLIGSLNKIGGLLLSVVNSTIVVLLLSLLLTPPLITNGKEVKEKTLFKYIEPATEEVIKKVAENVDFESLKQEITDIDTNEIRNQLQVWLIEQGIINE
ncbi:MAG: CvpA family protein [Erysipelotrichaceae bacterium]|nr:CvpA family protein [Erysipelotrichaceae bacterium]